MIIILQYSNKSGAISWLYSCPSPLVVVWCSCVLHDHDLTYPHVICWCCILWDSNGVFVSSTLKAWLSHSPMSYATCYFQLNLPNLISCYDKLYQLICQVTRSSMLWLQGLASYRSLVEWCVAIVRCDVAMLLMHGYS